jgi:hypothetical protein
MQRLLKPKKTQTKESFHLEEKVIEFISAGVACNCIVMLEELGIASLIKKTGFFSCKQIKTTNNPECIRSAFLTLVSCGVVKRQEAGFFLTNFGEELFRCRGLITIFFNGYSSLLKEQTKLALDTNYNVSVNKLQIAKASNLIAQEMIDPLLVDIFSELQFEGTICDLGCGLGSTLTKLCEVTNCPGLGFEISREIVTQASLEAKKNVCIECQDITKLEGAWEDIVILLQCHVFHDFIVGGQAEKLLDSYLQVFPNMKYFYYIDTVTPSESETKIFPGFDYIHGLQGIRTPTLEETLELFNNSQFSLNQQILIPGLPNTYLWILSRI